MKAPNNARGMEDDKASHYNNMFAPLNCVGGSEQGCEPFAVSLSLSLLLSLFTSLYFSRYVYIYIYVCIYIYIHIYI